MRRGREDCLFRRSSSGRCGGTDTLANVTDLAVVEVSQESSPGIGIIGVRTSLQRGSEERTGSMTPVTQTECRAETSAPRFWVWTLVGGAALAARYSGLPPAPSRSRGGLERAARAEPRSST